jgi:hypothetical protein
MTVAALRLSKHVNGVSRRHGDVSREIWAPLWPDRESTAVPIGHINSRRLGDLIDSPDAFAYDPLTVKRLRRYRDDRRRARYEGQRADPGSR